MVSPDPAWVARTHDPAWFAARFTELQANVERFVRGKPAVVNHALTCLLAGGHVLIEDVPGVGKTSLARAIAASITASVARIQLTPDLLPSDITGTPVWRPTTGDFEFHPGPVFANIVIADEINRASPKTQSALLEVMEEGRVTVGGTTRAVPDPFLVIATANPTEPSGIYQLPDAQLDRFLMSLTIGYPDHDDEVEVVRHRLTGQSPEQLPPVTDAAGLAALAAVARSVHVGPALLTYAVRLCSASRRRPELRLGASPRASVGLAAAARVRAAASGRAFTTADDVKAVAVPVLRHRLLLTPDAEDAGVTPERLVAELVDAVPVPIERGDHP
jgi:MoxR-like ATPase